MCTDSFNLEIKNCIVTAGAVSEKGVDKNINQDAFRIGYDEQKCLMYIIVADGLGSCKYSDQGSVRIIDIIEKWILNIL